MQYHKFWKYIQLVYNVNGSNTMQYQQVTGLKMFRLARRCIAPSPALWTTARSSSSATWDSMITGLQRFWKYDYRFSNMNSECHTGRMWGRLRMTGRSCLIATRCSQIPIYVICDMLKLRVTSSRSVLPKEPPVLTGSGVPRGSLSASQGERTIQDFKVIM